MRLVKCNLYDVFRVRLCKDYKIKNLTDLILNEKNNGLSVAILEDESENMSHSVDLNVGKRLICDCIEQ